MTRTKPIAQMTVLKPDGSWLTVEVRNDAGHNNFYHWYKGRGRGRKHLRDSHRTDGQVLLGKPIGLEILAKRFQHCTIKIKILHKKMYRRFLTCATDELPGYRAVISSVVHPPIPVTIPTGEYAHAHH